MATDSKAPVTRAVLNEALSELADTILQGMDGIAQNLRQELKGDIEELQQELQGDIGEVKTELAHVKDELKGIQGELSLTASKREVNELKALVARHHPQN